MKIFIGWSGDQSREIARAINWWLPKVINSIEPFFSEDELPKGDVWFSVLENELKNSRAGIICLTKTNIDNPWILFEAGAIWKALGNRVFTYLYNLNSVDIVGPLAQFQHTQVDIKDTSKLIKCLNELQDKPMKELDIDEIFEVWWPRLEARLQSISQETQKEGKASRAITDILEEILALTREQSKLLSENLIRDREKEQAILIGTEGTGKEDLIDILAQTRIAQHNKENWLKAQRLWNKMIEIQNKEVIEKK